ncbi:MAG: hypothetical protein ACP5VN_05450 [Acidobacteriota bacterium]
MRWTEGTARTLFAASLVLAAVLAAAAGARILEARGIWRAPGLPPPWGGIALWVLIAVSLLFGMDRGIPRESPWERRLYAARKVLLAAALVLVLVLAGLGGR